MAPQVMLQFLFIKKRIEIEWQTVADAGASFEGGAGGQSPPKEKEKKKKKKKKKKEKKRGKKRKKKVGNHE